ncbi:ATP-grasp domain-containing protein [Streptomyces albus]|uniref:ATP-grasp domain-containing protein n=1 Tax=Streptomyces albus TaxID=1888 RepID=UPI0004CA4757|nr:ATP-grasp domain-containing protein [Streptomyces albus]
MGALFIFCADPLRPRSADPHVADEVRAARAAGAATALIDHDALLAGDTAAAVARVPRGAGAAWYRGWMIPAGRYAELAEALAGRGVTLLTGPEAYRRAHELPGWYGTFAAVTPRSAWLPATPGEPPAESALAAAAAPLGGGPGIVKDYVKSRKHEWHEACYTPDLSDSGRLAAVARRMVELQDGFLTGGVVIRRFEEYPDPGEARMWWVDGVPVLTTAHPDHPGIRPAAALTAAGPRLAPLVAELGCRFVTTDLALRRDGVPHVVEAGDGQVSDLPPGTAGTAGGERLFRALVHAAGTRSTPR